jgi:hypothetical protein
MKKQPQSEVYLDEEIARRRDEVIRRMANTPPKPHSEMKLGKRKITESGRKQRVTRPPGAPIYKEPMVIIGIEACPDGTWRPFEPYRLLPNGSIESASLSSSV